MAEWFGVVSGEQECELVQVNNGYVTFDGPSSRYTPDPFKSFSFPLIAPFFADVDTRDPAANLVTYGLSPDGSTLCVDWLNVGYYNTHADEVNSFQLLLHNRADIAAGDVDATFNYGHLTWETGDADNGVGGIGGTPARAGWTDGTGATGTVELPGSGESGALLDGGANSLIAGSRASNVPGRYIFAIRGQ